MWRVVIGRSLHRLYCIRMLFATIGFDLREIVTEIVVIVFCH